MARHVVGLHRPPPQIQAYPVVEFISAASLHHGTACLGCKHFARPFPKEIVMAYVVCEPCRDCKATDCVDVCRRLLLPGWSQLYIIE